MHTPKIIVLFGLDRRQLTSVFSRVQGYGFEPFWFEKMVRFVHSVAVVSFPRGEYGF